MRYKVIIAGAALVLAAPAFADEWDFMLINDTGKEIKTVEVSVTGVATWQANKFDPEVRQTKTIKPAGRTTIHFDKDGDKCRYDVKAIFADDSNTVWSNINVCDNAYVTLRYKDGSPVFAAN